MTRLGNQAARSSGAEVGPNMTPLVDVVMVILIFLMLAGSFATGGWFLRSTMPVVPSGSNSVATAIDTKTVMLDLYVDRSADGFIARVGDATIKGDGERLKQLLDQRRLSFEAIGTKAQDVRVTLRPTRRVPYDQVIKVYEAAMRAQFTKVGFATSR